MSNSIRKYRIGGYRFGSVPESAKYHQAGQFETEQLPPKVDLRKYMTEVESQVGNSCVANAFVGAYEYMAKRTLGESADVSRLFVYYNARAQHNSEHEDAGTLMNAAIAALTEYGACSEDLWPNDEDKIFNKPDGEAYSQASNFKIEDAEFIQTDLDLWRHTLAEGSPIAFALNTFQSFDEATSNRGRVPSPKRSDNVRETHGWHAMLCVGYSDKDRMFIVRNSWGREWGDQGYCYIPYDYVIHADYNGHDSWIIKRVTDLDFSQDVWEDDNSWFGGEGELLITDFYLQTQDPEGFADMLDQLCLNYVDCEEDYYFDYQYDDSEDEIFVINILNFELRIDDSTEFLEALDTLCGSYAIDDDYDFHVDGDMDGEGDHRTNDSSEADYEEEPVDESLTSDDEDSEEVDGEEESDEEDEGDDEEEYDAEDYEEDGDDGEDEDYEEDGDDEEE